MMRRSSDTNIAAPSGAGAGSDSGVVSALQNVQSFFLRSKVPGRVRIGVVSGGSAPAGSAVVGPQFGEGTAVRTEGRGGVSESPDPAASIGVAREGGREIAVPSRAGSVEWEGKTSVPSVRPEKFSRLLSAPVVDIPPLRELSWNGIPPEHRASSWRILTGYVPPSSERQATLTRKRREYRDLVWQHFEQEEADRSEEELAILRQIAVDVPRTAPGVGFVREEPVQRMLERILFIRAMRSAASGYVQGMNDLVIPFLIVFLEEATCTADNVGIAEALATGVDKDRLMDAEADCYWCLCKLLDKIQTHYTFAQPGIQEKIFAVGALVRRIDADLADHLQNEGVDYVQFAFRWVNCLLQREVPLTLSLRLWDTYLAEGETFADFLTYVLAAFLLSWSDKLKKLEFQELVMFLQNLPTSHWKGSELEMVLAKAHQWRITFEHAPNHLH